MCCRSRLICVGALLLAAACDISDPELPDHRQSLRLTIMGGADQIDLPGALLAEPITVQLRQNGRSVPNRAITFRAPPRSGIEVDTAQTHTDSAGTASVRVRLGAVLGRHAIQIDYAGNRGGPGTVTLETAEQPVITEVAPSQARNGEPVIIRGHFSPLASTNDERIGGVRATVALASVSGLRVNVPRCLESGSTEVIVRRGPLESLPAALEVAGTGSRLVTLQAGEALREAGNLACLRLTAQADSARYLIIPLNTAAEGQPSATFQLSAASGDASAPAQDREPRRAARACQPRLAREYTRPSRAMYVSSTLSLSTAPTA